MIEDCVLVKISSNLITSDLFNPNRDIFSINLQSPRLYINKVFTTKLLQLTDNIIDNITLEFNFVKLQSDITLPVLNFQVELNLDEQ